MNLWPKNRTYFLKYVKIYIKPTLNMPMRYTFIFITESKTVNSELSKIKQNKFSLLFHSRLKTNHPLTKYLLTTGLSFTNSNREIAGHKHALNFCSCHIWKVLIDQPRAQGRACNLCCGYSPMGVDKGRKLMASSLQTAYHSCLQNLKRATELDTFWKVFLCGL